MKSVVIVVSTIISQSVHTVTVAHSTIDMKPPTQPVVPLVTQLVLNVKVKLKPIVLPVSQVLISLMELVQVLVVLMTDQMILSNVLKVGLYIKNIYVSKILGNTKKKLPSDPVPLVIGLKIQLTQLIQLIQSIQLIQLIQLKDGLLMLTSQVVCTHKLKTITL
jgi:hypothetical protein